MIRLTIESTISTLTIVKEPALLPNVLITAPPFDFSSVLHPVIVLGLEGVPLRVAMVFSAKSKHANLALLTLKAVIVTLVP